MDGTQTFTEATSELELNRWTIHSFVEIDHDGSLYHPLTDRRIPTGSDHHGALQPHGAHAALLVGHVRRYLWSTQRRPHKVRAYFRHPKVRYAA